MAFYLVLVYKECENLLPQVYKNILTFFQAQNGLMPKNKALDNPRSSVVKHKKSQKKGA